MPGVDAPTILASFRRRHPDVEVTSIFTSTTNQAPFLVDGRADVVFVRPPLPVDDAEIVPLFDEPQVAAVRRDHPLARRGPLLMAELEDAPLRLLRRRSATADPIDPQEALLAVAVGDAIALLPAGIAAFYADAAIAYIPVIDAPLQHVALAYDRNRAFPEIEAFVDICREHLTAALRALPESLAAGERADSSRL